MTQLLPRFHRRTLDRQDAAAIDKAVAESEPEPEVEKNPKNELAKPGDPRVLRSIPVIARGVGGTIPGTDPMRGCPSWRKS